MKFASEYQRIIGLGEEENPSQQNPKAKRGKTRCLLDRFIKYRTEICRFTADFDVPFDNNQAERDIRITKVKMKVSGGFRTELGAINFGKITSIIGTAVKQGLSVFKTISDMFSGSFNSFSASESAGTE